jgi:hypothetical protein
LEDCNKRGIHAELPQKYNDKAYDLAKANTTIIDDKAEWLSYLDE